MHLEWVVKIGGSLFPHHAKRLLGELVGENVIVVCGGGVFANKIRDYDLEFRFSDTASHESAILCMDIMGILLADLVDGAQATYTIRGAYRIKEDGKVPVILPSRILHYINSLPHSWDVTSDSIAFYISKILDAKLLIATDVDGIYTMSPSIEGAKLIKEIRARKLLSFGETSVDKELPKLLIENKSDCYVVNGKHPERVLSVIKSLGEICTLIRGD